MDNKQAIEELKKLYGNAIQIVDPISGEYKLDSRCTIAIDKAINSLEAWDKVIDELEEYKIIGSQMECFGTTEENAKEYIPIDTALDIINKHLI